jgi:hypothetical protein
MTGLCRSREASRPSDVTFTIMRILWQVDRRTGTDPPFLINLLLRAADARRRMAARVHRSPGFDARALLVPRPDPRHGSKYSVPTDQGMEERCCDVQQDGGEKHVGEHCVRHSQDRVQLVVMG